MADRYLHIIAVITTFVILAVIITIILICYLQKNYSPDFKTNPKPKIVLTPYLADRLTK